MGACARSINRQKNIFLALKYHCLVRIRGNLQALVVLERALLTLIQHDGMTSILTAALAQVEVGQDVLGALAQGAAELARLDRATG